MQIILHKHLNLTQEFEGLTACTLEPNIKLFKVNLIQIAD
ncbi:hypothetical protein NIES21_27490 [Anabaenopsis circularis NIES-21]|uniref:Uncharacterized protein n=1 Tax=Anabaenopsis circularis NIES-21 TaxID=1085406 RepID=A0A1Z4GHF8_9CYAN|nr:hypothetical protein NIES21_27490 [Anabaenopsis circularis NIES-21]